MATTYEVRLAVLDKGRADPPVGEVLQRSLADSDRVEVTTEPSEAGQGGDSALVRVWVDAQDSSEAKLMVLDRVNAALAEAGLREPAVVVGDPDARASS